MEKHSACVQNALPLPASWDLCASIRGFEIPCRHTSVNSFPFGITFGGTSKVHGDATGLLPSQRTLRGLCDDECITPFARTKKLLPHTPL